MQYLKSALSILLIFGYGLSEGYTQTIFINQIENSQTSFLLSNIRKISFSNDNLSVTDNNTLSDINLNSIKSIDFLNETKINENALHNLSFGVYPNPVSEFLYFELSGFSDKEATISIIKIDGQLMLSQKAANLNPIKIDVTSLPTGLYLCYYKSESENLTFKIIKL